MEPIIKLSNLSKTFLNGNQKNKVLKNINLEISPGQVIGYIGPNGAGKSTTVKIICGLIDTFKGDVQVAGMDIRTNIVEIKKRIGYIPENATIYESLTPMEFFAFIAEMRGLNANDAKDRAMRFLKLFEIEHNAHQRIGSFSKGMKQKVLITSALLHNPEILFMDEPLSGLDTNSVIKVKEIVTRLAAEGKTIFYSSHLMDVVEKVSSRIILINDGQIIADGTFEELKGSYQEDSLEKMFARLTGHLTENTVEIDETLKN